MALAGKVVLVGNQHRLSKDFFQAPLSCGTPGEREIFGTALLGQITSQLIRQALGEERPLRTTGQLLGDARLGQVADALWIWLCIGVCGLAVLRLQGGAVLYAASGLMLALTLVTITAFLVFGWWLPVVPPVVGGAQALILGFAYSFAFERAERGSLMRMFSVYLERSVAETLWAQRDSFTADGRPVPQTLTATVLFTNVASFAAVSERMPPDQLMAWLNRYMEAMVQVIVARGGVIDKFIGDAIMAVFGVPIPRRSEAEVAHDACSAVDAAIAMREELERLNPKWQEEGLPPVRMRVGIHTGALVAGSLGGTARLQYTVIGDTVNTAARLESYDKDDPRANRPGELCRILISDATLRLLGDRYVTEPVGEVKVKSKQQHVTVYRVEGVAAAPSPPLPDRLDQGSEPMVEHETKARQRRVASAAVALVWVVAMGAGEVLAEQQPAAPPAPPVFIPSDLGAPQTRLVAGVRGHTIDAGPDVPLVLAAEGTGLTGTGQPTLYWFLEAPVSVPLAITITAEPPPPTGEPVLELQLDASPEPGLHALGLAAHDKALAPRHLHRWHVQAVMDPKNPSLDLGSSGTIMWVEPDADLLARMSGAPVLSRLELLAGAGYWYDALDLLSRQIAAGDTSQPWHQLRASLLEQVGLEAAAALDQAKAAQ